MLASAAVSAVYAVLTLPLLGVPEIYQVSEGREGIVVDEILRTGELILPLRHGTVVPSKPMLYHWLAAAAAKISGRDDEFALRLPSLLAACLLLGAFCFTVGCINRRRSTKIALAAASVGGSAAILLGLCLGFVRQATDSRVDMVFLALSIGAILVLFEPLIIRAAAIGGSTDKRSEIVQSVPFSDLRLLVFFSLIGLSVLAKGPLGLVMPVLVVVPYAVLIGGWRGLKWFLRWPIVFSLILPLPWYVLAAMKGGSSFVGRQLFFENIGRFTGAAGITQKPFWFYLPHIFEQAAPLIELLLLFCAALTYPPFRRRFGGVLRQFEPMESAQITFSIVWIVNLLLFFSAASGKRASYLVAVLPPIAVLFTIAVFRFGKILKAEPAPEMEKHGEPKTIDCDKHSSTAAPFFPRIVKAGFILWGAVPAVFALIFLAGTVAERSPGAVSNRIFRTVFAFSDVVSQSPAVCFGYLAAFVLTGGWFWHHGNRRRRGTDLLLSVSLFWALAVFLVFPIVQGIRGVTHGYKKFAGQISAAVRPEEKLTFIKSTAEESFDGFFFYVKQRIELSDPDHPPAAAGLYLARSHWIDRQPETWRSSVVPLLRGGRQVDPPENEVVLFRFNGLPENVDSPSAAAVPDLPGSGITPLIE